MSYIKSLKCKECGREYSISPVHVCEFCFGPLEVVYDYEKIKESLTREKIEARPKSMWRYRELLPLDNDPSVGMNVGYTPLIRAEGLARALGVKELYLKNDAVNYPTLSFKDRVVSVALSKAKEFGFHIVACASTEILPIRLQPWLQQEVSRVISSFLMIWSRKDSWHLVYGTNLIGIKEVMMR
jgi:threonine synthase